MSVPALLHRCTTLSSRPPLVIAGVDLHAILLVVSIATATKWPKDNRGALGEPEEGF